MKTKITCITVCIHSILGSCIHDNKTQVKKSTHEAITIDKNKKKL